MLEKAKVGAKRINAIKKIRVFFISSLLSLNFYAKLMPN